MTQRSLNEDPKYLPWEAIEESLKVYGKTTNESYTRRHDMKIFSFIIALAIAFTSPAWAATQPKGSGFIDNLPSLNSIRGVEGGWGWDNSSFQQKNYNKIYLDPIEIFIASDSKYKGLNPDHMKTLTDTMRAALIESLEPDYPVVSKPGPGVLRVRFAITNVYLGKPKHKFGQYTPIGLIASGVKKAKGTSKKNYSLQNASVEAEIFDSQSGERLAVRIDTKPIKVSEQTKKQAWGDDDEDEKQKAAKMSWEAVVESMRFYSEHFRARLDKGRAK